MAACAHGTSIEDICGQLEEDPPARTVRYQLAQSLLGEAAVQEALERIEEAANAVLTTYLPPGLRVRPREAAVDFTLVPYHGQAYQDEGEIRRGQAKGGTTHFHCYATAYVMLQGKRVNLSLTYVRAKDSLVEVLGRLRGWLGWIGVGIAVLYLDKQFYTVEVIRYLQQQPFASVIAAVMRGKEGDKRVLGAGPTRMESYTMHSRKAGSVTFPLAVVVKNSRGKYGRQGREYFCYAVLNGGPSEQQVYEAYRRRFGIESSYRLLHEGRARTSSRNPVLHLLYVLISLLMQNLWVWLKWHLSPPRRGGRDSRKAGCSFRRFQHLIGEAVRRLYGFRHHLRFPTADLPEPLRTLAA
ncbi:MAG: transposase [Candidatus Hadarchaeum sp.]